MIEIERKFTVHKELWKTIKKPQSFLIKQSYISDNKNSTVRVRTKGEKGFLTIKGITKNISRSEFEYEIPLVDAESMMEEFSNKILSKKRYEIKVGNHIWEVDEFNGKLEGLIIAEIELQDENENFTLPNWIDKEVSKDERYYNSNLINEL
jgi:adenylate cyclase